MEFTPNRTTIQNMEFIKKVNEIDTAKQFLKF